MIHTICICIYSLCVIYVLIYYISIMFMSIFIYFYYIQSSQVTMLVRIRSESGLRQCLEQVLSSLYWVSGGEKLSHTSQKSAKPGDFPRNEGLSLKHMHGKLTVPSSSILASLRSFVASTSSLCNTTSCYHRQFLNS